MKAKGCKHNLARYSAHIVCTNAFAHGVKKTLSLLISCNVPKHKRKPFFCFWKAEAVFPAVRFVCNVVSSEGQWAWDVLHGGHKGCLLLFFLIVADVGGRASRTRSLLSLNDHMTSVCMEVPCPVFLCLSHAIVCFLSMAGMAKGHGRWLDPLRMWEIAISGMFDLA